MFFMNLLNRRILVVEEDNTRASSVSAALEFQGSDVVGPFHSLREGLDAVKQVEIDAAVLNVCLGEDRVYSLADKLNANGIPFIFITDPDGEVVPTRFSAVHCLQKPFDMDAMAITLAISLAKKRKVAH
jgi:DNA-binding NtrC family response regulator